MFGNEDETYRRQDMNPRAWKRPPQPSLRLPDEDRDDYDAGRSESPHELDGPINADMHNRLLSYYAHELYAQQGQRSEMMTDENYFDGEQWTARDKAELEARGQHPLVFNMVAPAVNWLLGTERRSRTQFKVLPRRKDGSKAAERKSQLMKYLNDANREEYHVSRAFADAVKVGIGWLEDGYQGEGEEEPVFSRAESWRNMLWDSRATELDIEDARYIFRAKWTDLDVATQFFPDRINVLHAANTAEVDVGATYLDGYADEPMDEAELMHDRVNSPGGVGPEGYGVRRRVRLIECWYKVPVETEIMTGGQFSGEIYDKESIGHFDALILGESRLQKQVKMRVHVAVLTASGMLYNDVSPYRHNRYPFTPIWGNRRGSDGMPYGIIRNLRDIQQDLNKRASKALHILSSSKIIMDEGAVKDLDELAEEAARPDAIIVKKQGKELRLDQQRDLAASHMELMSRDINMIQQASGVTDEAMGRTTNASSGKAIIARQQQGSVATAHFLDNLRLAMRIHGEKQLSLIEQYFTDQKEFRITNQRGTPDYVAVNDGMPENDIVATKADFVISEDDWKATMRQAQVEELMAVIQQLAPAQPQIVLMLLDLLVEAMDIPSREEIVARIRQLSGMEDPDADPDAQDPDTLARKEAKAKQAAMEERVAMANLTKLEAEAQEKAASAEHKAAQAGKTRGELAAQETKDTADRLDLAERALQAALAYIQSRAAAPLADRMLADARLEGQATMPPALPNASL